MTQVDTLSDSSILTLPFSWTTTALIPPVHLSLPAEILLGILRQHGYVQASTPEAADVVLLNTCSIREKAEQKVRVCLDSGRQATMTSVHQ